MGLLVKEGVGVRTETLVLSGSPEVRELMKKNKTNMIIRGTTMRSTLTMTPNRVKRRWVRVPTVSKKNNSSFLRGRDGWLSLPEYCLSDCIN